MLENPHKHKEPVIGVTVYAVM